MDAKKGFKVYYLLIAEGAADFNLFAYLTTKRFRELFEVSNVKFRNNAEIIKDGVQIIMQGKLYGAGNMGDFKAKHALIKAKYSDQTIFFLLDKDLDDSLDIEKLIKQGGDMLQFIEYNSEYLLLKFAGKNLQPPSNFKSLNNFRSYCKAEFLKHFKKQAHELKDIDFDRIFNNVSDEEVRNSLAELFGTLT